MHFPAGESDGEHRDNSADVIRRGKKAGSSGGKVKLLLDLRERIRGRSEWEKGRENKFKREGGRGRVYTVQCSSIDRQYSRC